MQNTVSPIDGQLVRPILEKFNHFGKLEHRHIQIIFSYCDIFMEACLAAVNKAWDQAIKNSVYLEKQTSDESIKGNRDTYILLHKMITREQGERLFLQTGLELPFKAGDRFLRNFTLGKVRLSDGGVFIGFSKKLNEFVAIKKMRKEIFFKREMVFQIIFSNASNVLTSQEYMRTIDLDGKISYYQIQKLAGLGALDSIIPQIQSLEDIKLKEQLIFIIIESVLKGLESLHQKGVCHLDVKPANVVIGADGKVSIIDFEFAAKMSKGLIDAKETCGDKDFYSPERWIQDHDGAKGICSGIKIDIWAAGLILLSLAGIDIRVFNEKEMENVLTSVTIGRGSVQDAIDAFYKFFQKTLQSIEVLKDPPPDSYFNLAKWLMEFNPEERLDASKALTHPYLKKIGSTLGDGEVVKMRLWELVQSTRRKTSDDTTKFRLSPQSLPFPFFSHFVKRRSIYEMLKKSILSSCFEKSSITVLSGMGGTGKTTLAAHFLHEEIVRNNFSHRFWFRGVDNLANLQFQYKCLAQELRLIESPEVSFAVAFDALILYLETLFAQTGKPWLAVYDNTGIPDQLVHFLFPKGGQIILTTRSKAWDNSICVDVMTAEEGSNLVQTILDEKGVLANELCKRMGYLPLAIAQACAFIRNQGIKLADYLKKPVEDSLTLDERAFGVKLPSSLCQLWDESCEAIKKIDLDALELLKSLAYLSPDGVPTEIIETLASSKSLKLLQDYSLVNTHDNGVHRFVQLAIRQKYSFDNERILIKLMELLDGKYDLANGTIRPLKEISFFYINGEELRAAGEKITSVSKPFLSFYSKTLRWLADTYRIMGQSLEHAEKLLNHSLKIFENIYEPNHFEIGWTLNSLGLLNLGIKREKSIDYFLRALEIRKKVYGPDHVNTAMAHDNLGTAWHGIDNDEATKNHEIALEIFLFFEVKDISIICSFQGIFRRNLFWLLIIIKL